MFAKRGQKSSSVIETSGPLSDSKTCYKCILLKWILYCFLEMYLYNPWYVQNNQALPLRLNATIYLDWILVFWTVAHDYWHALWKWPPYVLSLDVRGPSYLGLTRSVSWLLMPWLLALPGHQQPWYWLCKIGKSFSYTRKDFNNLWHVSVEEWNEMEIHVYVSSEKFST